MHSILFVSSNDICPGYVPAGGTYGSRIHLETLRSIEGIEVTALALSRKRCAADDADVRMLPATKSAFDTLLKNCMGYADYMSPEAEREIFRCLNSRHYDILFLDNSCQGRIAKKARKRYPSIKIITFFHDVAYMFMRTKVRVQGPRYLPMFFASWYNESLAVRYSDVLVAISERDKLILEKKYRTGVSYILPPCYDDYEAADRDKALSHPIEVLFFGIWTYHNLSGIRWFIEKVLPNADIKLFVAGRGMERLRNFYPENEKLRIVGEVGDAGEWYSRADCVAAPIIDGTGMKIKTGEALRYGKTVVGTREAFAGYHITNGKEGYVCETPEEYLAAFKEIALHQKGKFNPASHAYCRTWLSRQNALETMRKIVGL